MSRLSLSVSTNTGEVLDDFKRFMTKVPEFEKDMSYQIAKLFANEIKHSIMGLKLMWDKELLRSLNDIQKTYSPRGGWAHTINIRRDTPRSGVDAAAWHEFADSGHWVATYKDENRPIQEWLDSQPSRGPFTPSSIYVTPTPFVRPAIQPAAAKMRRLSVNEITDFVNKHIEVVDA